MSTTTEPVKLPADFGAQVHDCLTQPDPVCALRALVLRLWVLPVLQERVEVHALTEQPVRHDDADATAAVLDITHTLAGAPPGAASPAPRHVQIAWELREQITTGALAQGSRLPAQKILAEHHQVPAAVLRQAQDLLVREGLLLWAQTRKGFVVRDNARARAAGGDYLYALLIRRRDEIRAGTRHAHPGELDLVESLLRERWWHR